MLAKPSSGFANFLFAGFHLKPPVSCRNCFGKDCFGATPKPTRGTRALPRRNCDLEHFTRAAPGEGESGAAVAVVVNDGATIGEAIAFETHA